MGQTYLYSSEARVSRPRRCGGNGDWCPICGAWYARVLGGQGRHRCKPSVLAAIDGAMRRDPDFEEPKVRRSFNQRLADGFLMLDDERDEEDIPWPGCSA